MTDPDQRLTAIEGQPPRKEKKKVMRKVEQLIGEWVIEEAAKLGSQKRETEQKNS